VADIPRRRFLQNTLTATAGCSATFMLGKTLFAQAPGNAATRGYLDSRAPCLLSTATFSAGFSNTSAEPSTKEFTIPSPSSPIRTASAPISPTKSSSSACPSCAIPGETLSLATIGWTASGPKKIARVNWTRPGTPSRPTNSAPTNSWSGANSPARNH
jgi:hypothetical protein